MNNLVKIENWYISKCSDGHYIFGDLSTGGFCSKKIIRIDFENKIIEVDNEYYELGEERL